MATDHTGGNGSGGYGIRADSAIYTIYTGIGPARIMGQSLTINTTPAERLPARPTNSGRPGIDPIGGTNTVNVYGGTVTTVAQTCL